MYCHDHNIVMLSFTTSASGGSLGVDVHCIVSSYPQGSSFSIIMQFFPMMVLLRSNGLVTYWDNFPRSSFDTCFDITLSSSALLIL